jgi:ribonuclease HI
MNPYAAQLYIDGSCLKNPGGAGGFAGIFEKPDDNTEPEVIFQEGYKNTTNNRMEIRALIKALEYIKDNSLELKDNEINQIEIRSDSETAIKCYKYAEDWRANSWNGLDGHPISNIDLVKRILTLKSSISFSYRVEYILNKSTEQTTRVDKLAKAAAKKPTKDDIGYIKPKACRTSVKGCTLLFNANGQKLKIKVFEHCPISKRKSSLYKVKFEIVVNGITEKYFTYCSQDINNLLHRHHFYVAQFNCDKKKPMIEEAKEVKG